MSTNNLQIPKQSGTILLFSGIYLFFITLIIGPFLNFPIFSTLHTTTKLLLVVSAGILSIFQLLSYVPRISKTFIRSLSPYFINLLRIAGGSLLISTLFSTSLKTALFGMFTTWESNILIYIVYFMLFLAWYVHFYLARHLKIETLLFNTLTTLLLITTIAFGLGEYYIWQPSTGYISLSVTRLSLAFRNPLFAGYFIGMLWSFQVIRTYFSFLVEKQSYKIATSLGNLLLTGGITHILLLTYTRSAWISSLLSIAIIFTILIWLQLKKKTFNIGKFITIMITITMVIAPQIYLLKNSIIKRSSDLIVESQNTLSAIANTLGSSTSQEEALSFFQDVNSYSSADIRLMEWKWGIKTWAASFKNFFFGVGSDNLYFDMPKYRDPIFNSLPTDSSTKPFYIRNLFITSLVEHGLIFTFSSLLLLLYTFIQLIKYLSLQSTSAKAVQLVIIPFTLIVSWLAQGIFYFPTHITTVLMIFALSFTTAQVTNFTKISLRPPTKSEKGLLFSIAIIISIWLALIIKTEAIIALYKASPLPVEATIMEQNAKLPINNKILKRYLAYYYPARDSSQKYLLEMIDSKDPDDLRIASDAFYTFARNERNTTALTNSITAIENLIEIDNSLSSTWDARGLRYLYKGDFETATESFNKALELKSDYWYAYLHLGEVSRQQCNPEGAIEFYNQAAQFIPSAEVEISEARQEIETPREECMK